MSSVSAHEAAAIESNWIRRDYCNCKFLQWVQVADTSSSDLDGWFPLSRRVARHRRTASFRALGAIIEISPAREADRREERRRFYRSRCRRASAPLLREMWLFFGLPEPLFFGRYSLEPLFFGLPTCTATTAPASGFGVNHLCPGHAARAWTPPAAATYP